MNFNYFQVIDDSTINYILYNTDCRESIFKTCHFYCNFDSLRLNENYWNVKLELSAHTVSDKTVKYKFLTLKPLKIDSEV